MEQPTTVRRTTDENRILAALAYPIWIVALIILLTDMKKDPFLRRHAVQALGYTLAWVVVYFGLSVVTSFSDLGLWRLYFLWPLVRFAWLAIAVYYGYQAYQGQMFSIPVVRRFTAQYAAAER